VRRHSSVNERAMGLATQRYGRRMSTDAQSDTKDLPAHKEEV